MEFILKIKGGSFVCELQKTIPGWEQKVGGFSSLQYTIKKHLRICSI